MNLTELLNKLWPWNEIRDLEIELNDCRFESNLMDIEISKMESVIYSRSNALDATKRSLQRMRQELSTRVTAAEKIASEETVARIKCEERLAECQGAANPLERSVMSIAQVEPSEKNWFILNSTVTNTMRISPVVLQEVTQDFFNWFNASVYLQMVSTNGEFRLPDNKQYSTDIATWKKIIERDPTDRSTYVIDKFDCENFIGKLRENIADTYGLNALHEAWGKYTDDDGNVVVHAFGVIYATDGVYVVKPQIDIIHGLDVTLEPIYRLTNMIWFE